MGVEFGRMQGRLSLYDNSQMHDWLIQKRGAYWGIQG
jgi:hypothetical protein